MVALDCVVVMYINVTGFWVCTNLSVGISAADFTSQSQEILADAKVYQSHACSEPLLVHW